VSAHGWRNSKPTQVDERPCLIVSQDPPLVLAGDGFAGPRVESAALSGWGRRRENPDGYVMTVACPIEWLL
jgi:predicted NAD/FAD-dependent oxidoreductase